MTPPLRPVPEIPDHQLGTRDAITAIATSQIGYREGANNDTAFGAWYGWPNVAWCAQFVSWAAARAGVPSGVIPKYQYTPAGHDWFASHGRLHSTPRAGDVGFVYFSSLGRIGHTFLVLDVSTSAQGTTLVHTCEGNTNDSGSSQGIGVFRLTRVDTANLSYGRPDYAQPSSDGQTFVEDDMSDAQYAELNAKIDKVLQVFGRTVAAGQHSFEATVEASLGQAQSNFNEIRAAAGEASRATDVLAFRGADRPELYLFGFGNGLVHLPDDAVRVELERKEVLRTVVLEQTAMDTLLALSA